MVRVPHLLTRYKIIPSVSTCRTHQTWKLPEHPTGNSAESVVTPTTQKIAMPTDDRRLPHIYQDKRDATPPSAAREWSGSAGNPHNHCPGRIFAPRINSFRMNWPGPGVCRPRTVIGRVIVCGNKYVPHVIYACQRIRYFRRIQKHAVP